MIIGVILLALPGALYNNASNSGLVLVGGTIGNCDSTLDICSYTNNVACQAAAGNCALTGQTISFLNGNSPFTQLMQGNLFALFNNLNPLSSTASGQTSWSGTHGPFDVTGNPNYYAADCQGTTPISTSRSQTNWVLTMCTQAGNDGKNVTEANAATWNSWNTNWISVGALQFYNLGNATYPRSCSQLAQINYTLLGNSGYTYFGCEIATPTIQGIGTQPTNRAWGYLVAMPVSYGAMPAGASHQYLFVQLENWATFECLPNINMGYYSSVPCQNFVNGFKGFTIPGTSVSFVPNSSGGIVFGFISGIILLLGGVGLQLGFGGGVSAGVNRQGTKLFQVLGIGLILWSFLYSEFSFWFTSGNLPYGLDGALGIVSVMLSGVFFFGIYKQATTD